MGYRKVLIAFDGSEGSMKALREGIDYAKHNGSDLSLVYVAKLDKRDVIEGMPGGGTVPMAPELLHDQLKNSDPGNGSPVGSVVEQEEQQLQEKGEEVFRHARAELNRENIEAKTEVLEGEVAESIIRYAEENDASLIMIGNRGLGGLKKLVLGSVSQKVVQKASCPVLVVK